MDSVLWRAMTSAGGADSPVVSACVGKRFLMGEGEK